MSDQTISFEELFGELEKGAEFRREDRLLRPRFDVAYLVMKLRNQQKMTQKELAQRAGTHQSRISKIESGDYDLRLSTLSEIAEALQAMVVIDFVPIPDEEYEWEAVKICGPAAAGAVQMSSFAPVPQETAAFNVGG